MSIITSKTVNNSKIRIKKSKPLKLFKLIIKSLKKRLFYVLLVKSPLAHKTRKNTTKNWIKIARAPELSLFKSILHYCGIKVICFNSFYIFDYTLYFSKNSKIRCRVGDY